MVRLGGRSKIEAIQNLSVQNLTRNKSSAQKRGEWLCYGEFDIIKRQLEEMNESVSKKDVEWSELSIYLEGNHVDFYCDFLAKAEEIQKELEGGWKTAKSQKSRDVVDFWLRGLDIKLYQRRQNNKKHLNLLRASNKEQHSPSLDMLTLLNLDEEVFDFNRKRPLNVLLEVTNIWNTSQFERRILLNHWKGLLVQNVFNEYAALGRKLENIRNRLNEIQDATLADLLRNQNVIGVTTTGAGKYRNLIASIGPSIIVCEEAGKY